MTPFHTGSHILIQAGLPPEQTLRVIADELWHLCQDQQYGPEWRIENDEFAEHQAADFANSQADDTSEFLSLISLRSPCKEAFDTANT